MEYLKLSVGLILGYELRGARLKGQVLQMVRHRSRVHQFQLELLVGKVGR